jgi:hypothetical protein
MAETCGGVCAKQAHVTILAALPLNPASRVSTDVWLADHRGSRCVGRRPGENPFLVNSAQDAGGYPATDATAPVLLIWLMSCEVWLLCELYWNRLESAPCFQSLAAGGLLHPLAAIRAPASALTAALRPEERAGAAESSAVCQFNTRCAGYKARGSPASCCCVQLPQDEVAACLASYLLCTTNSSLTPKTAFQSAARVKPVSM